MSDNKPKIVVIGGGTGTSVVLSGLKKRPLDLSAVISMADSGGSTGRLRDEFGFSPVGDLRQALAALASDADNSSIAKLLLYRFTKGSGLEGHNLGNLILTALQDMTGSTAAALSVAGNIFKLNGQIYPVTHTNIQLVIEYEDGQVEIGESVLDHQNGGKKILSVKTSPRATLNPEAQAALLAADTIVIGPGDLYGSLLPNLVIGGMSATLSRSSAKIVYILNLMTHYTQTHNMTAADHLRAVESQLDRAVDYVLVNTAPIPPNLIASYQNQHEYPVKDDLGDRPGVIRTELITKVKNYLRHDPDKLASAIMSIINPDSGKGI